MTTPYTAFVKEQYPSMKASNPETNSKDILRLIAAEWNKTKPPKVDKPKAEKKVKVPKEPTEPKVKAKPAPKRAKPIEINGENIKDQIDNIIEDDSPTTPPTNVKTNSKTRKVTEKKNGATKTRKGEAAPPNTNDNQETVK